MLIAVVAARNAVWVSDVRRAVIVQAGPVSMDVADVGFLFQLGRSLSMPLIFTSCQLYQQSARRR